MRAKLDRRGTDSESKRKDRSEAAPDEIQHAASYTHILLNPAGEDDIDEWKCFGTQGGKPGVGRVECLTDLAPNARWLIDTFIKIVAEDLPPGYYEPPGYYAPQV